MEIQTIAFLGTSLSAGTGATQGSWVNALLASLAPGKQARLRAVNCAEGGYSSAEGLAAVSKAAGIRADVAVIEFAVNDCETSRSMSVGASQANHEAIIAALRASRSDISIFLATMNPVISSLTGENRNSLETYNQVYRDIAAPQGVGLIDIYPLWGTPTEAEAPDGLHPTLQANIAVTVPAIRDALSSLII